MRAGISLPTARLRPIPDTVSAARIVQECRAGQEVIRVGSASVAQLADNPASSSSAGRCRGRPGRPLSRWPAPPGTAVTAKAVQAAGACLSDRTASSRQTGSREPAPGRAAGQGHARGLSVAFRPRILRPPRRGPSGFPVGASCGRPCPSWVMMYAPPRFQRNSGNGVLVTWPGGVPARRARRQWR